MPKVVGDVRIILDSGRSDYYSIFKDPAGRQQPVELHKAARPHTPCSMQQPVWSFGTDGTQVVESIVKSPGRSRGTNICGCHNGE
jgi:hypothetical protein